MRALHPLLLVPAALAALAFGGCKKSEPTAVDAGPSTQEAQQELARLFALETAYAQKNGKLARSFAELGDAPPPHRRDAYFLIHDERQPDVGGPYQIPVALRHEVVDLNAVAVAVGNLDGDATLDVWLLDRSGQALHLVDDLAPTQRP